MERTPDDHSVRNSATKEHDECALDFFRVLQLIACVGMIYFVDQLIGYKVVWVAGSLHCLKAVAYMGAVALAILAMKYHVTIRSLGRIVSSILVLVVAFCLIELVIYLVMPQVFRHPSHWRPYCENYMNQLGRAIIIYCDSERKPPQLAICDAEGQQLHGWFTSLLPYCEMNALYKEIDLEKAWDDPSNLEFTQKDIGWLRCPFQPYDPDHHSLTYYVAVTGPGTIWSEPEGDRANKIMLVETASPVPWAKPYALSADDLPEGETDVRRLASSNHRRTRLFSRHFYEGGNILYGDGHVEFFQKSERIEVRWDQVSLAAMAVLCLFGALLIPVRQRTISSEKDD